MKIDEDLIQLLKNYLNNINYGYKKKQDINKELELAKRDKQRLGKLVIQLILEEQVLILVIVIIIVELVDTQ